MLKKSTPAASSSPAPLNTVVTPQIPAKAIPKSTGVGRPVRLKIPKINVDAALDQVSLTADGELDAPTDPSTAGWYNQGPRPGDPGSAIIDGHFGYKNHIPAVFDELYSLQKGDIISIEDENGASISFVVRELRTYSPSEDTASVFASNDGKARLNVITCQGDWNNAQKSFSARLVVFTDKITVN